MKQGYDVVVVGAGPIGCFTAWNLAEEGYSVLLLEEHECAGLPLHCAGLVSPRVLRFLPGSSRTGVVLAKMNQACIHPPDGSHFYIRSERVKALVIDRIKFDMTLAEMASNSGAEVCFSTRVKGVKGSPNRYHVSTSKGELSGRVVIGSDGAYSLLARVFEFPPVEEVIPACVYYMECEESDSVDIYLGSEIAPGFFAWIIRGGGRVNIGLGTRKRVNPLPYMKKFLKMIGLTGSVARGGYYSWGIPVGPRAYTVRDGVALVGDAAGHAKPMSGGGLFTGLMCASLLVEVVADALERNTPLLEPYEKLWRKTIGKEISRGMTMRRIYLQMDDHEIADICRVFSSADLLSVISEKGDIDYPSRLVLPLLRKAPHLAKFAGPFLKSLIQRWKASMGLMEIEDYSQHPEQPRKKDQQV